MPHNKKYTVTNQPPQPFTPSQPPPQPHVMILVTKERSNKNLCSGWIPCITIGAAAITFILCIHYLGGAALFPKALNTESVPILKKGYLQVVPFVDDSISSIHDPFLIKLPPTKISVEKYIQTLDQLLKGYPEKYEAPYKNCWLENPTEEHPCFYGQSWLTQTCTRNNSYGYEVFGGEYSPCFILRFVNTKDWTPLPSTRSSIGMAYNHFDPGFIPIDCFFEDETYINDSTNIDIYPPKGFSHLYFPESHFNASLYLAPLVAVKVKGIQNGMNVTIKCAIATPNAFVLKNNGMVSITFSST